VEAAELRETEEAAGLDRLHEESDPVHVGGEHRPRPWCGGAPLDPAMDIPGAVPLDAVGMDRECLRDRVRGRRFVPRDPRQAAQESEPIDGGAWFRTGHSLRI